MDPSFFFSSSGNCDYGKNMARLVPRLIPGIHVGITFSSMTSQPPRQSDRRDLQEGGTVFFFCSEWVDGGYVNGVGDYGITTCLTVITDVSKRELKARIMQSFSCAGTRGLIPMMGYTVVGPELFKYTSIQHKRAHTYRKCTNSEEINLHHVFNASRIDFVLHAFLIFIIYLRF